MQRAQPFRRAGQEPDARRIDVVRDVFDQRAVLVEEDGAPRADHGHEVSRIGSTITSGITVSSGCIRTKRIVSATLRGSCRFSNGVSGKRSRMKGVLMPPLTIAVTLIPCGRPSTCSAWLRPRSPHLLAW